LLSDAARHRVIEITTKPGISEQAVSPTLARQLQINSSSRDMRDRGYTLIELLVVVAIIGVVAAIAIPNLLNSLGRARQKRTMADIRALGEAIEMYQTDHQFYPNYSNVTAENLGNALKIYVRAYNSRDGWNQPFHYDSDGEHYTVLSYGSDRSPGPNTGLGTTTSLKADIVFSNGVFVQWPEGVQRE
jgi:general secretion pathway protein G